MLDAEPDAHPHILGIGVMSHSRGHTVCFGSVKSRIHHLTGFKSTKTLLIFHDIDVLSNRNQPQSLTCYICDVNGKGKLTKRVILANTMSGRRRHYGAAVHLRLSSKKHLRMAQNLKHTDKYI